MKSPNFEFHLNGIVKSMHRLIFISLFIFTNTFIYSQQPAFPTANGGGSNATGGRGQSVYHVTKLTDDGSTGTFRDAVSQGNRTIVFDVSGTIEILLSNGTISFPSNITIAGQTAPEGGITIVSPSIGSDGADNVIIRYVKFRHTLPDGSWGGDDAVRFANSDNVILDHCSFSWGGDEIVTFWQSSKDITIQNCLIAEGKTGSIFGDSDNTSINYRMSYLRNMHYNVPHRQPNANSDDRQDIINNVIFNWKSRLSVVEGTNKINHISNYYSMGLLDQIDQHGMQLVAEEGQSIYTSGNMVVKEGTILLDKTDDPWDYAENTPTNTDCLFQDRGDGWGPYPAIDPDLYTDLRKDTPHTDLVNPPTIIEADVLIDTLKDDCGANASLNADGSVTIGHDLLDTVYMDGIVAETGISYNADSGGHNFHTTDHWSTFWASVSSAPINTRSGSYDSDNDGMSDVWETTTFGDLTRDGTLDQDGDGYTDLEEFLNLVDGEQANRPIITRTDSNPTTIEVNGTYTQPTGTWTDVEDGTGTASIGGDTVNVNTLGTYNVTLEHTDTDGNRGYLTIPVQIIPEFVNATDVLITPETVIVEEGITTQLVAEFTPSNTTDQTGVWISNFTNIATVDPDSGLVTGIAEGTATISFTSNDGGITANSTVSVTPKLPPLAPVLDSVVLSGNDYILSFSQPDGTGVPIGGYDTFINDVDQSDNASHIGFTRTITGLDTSIEQRFKLEARYTDLDPQQFLQSNEIAVAADVGTVEANAGEDQSICENESVILTASGGPNYLWNTGETTQSITVSPSVTTTYSVTVSNGPSTDSDEVVVTVNPRPSVNAGNDVDIYQNESITLTASGDGTFTWSNGEETQSITVSPTETTTYTVTANLNGCTSSDTVTVTVLEPEQVSANAGEDKSICENESVTLTASGGPNYLWSTGETTQSITVSPTVTTTYSVTVFNDDISDTDEVTVTVNPYPTAGAGGDRTILSGDSITLSASGGSEFIWSTGETTQEIVVEPLETTTYTVEVIENGCSDMASVTVIVGVSASVGGESTICQGESTTLYAAGGSYFLWSTGETTQSIEVTPSQTTTYSVVVSNNSSSDEAEITVNVNLLPEANAGEDVTIESGQNVTLTASGGNSYLWSNGETTQNISVSPSDTTTYTVESIINGCSDSDDVKVTVVQQVNASAGEDTQICVGESIELTATGGLYFTWDTGEETASISVSPDETTVYTVTVSNGFSSQTAEVVVTVEDCQAINNLPQNFSSEFTVYPNPTIGQVNIRLSGIENVSSIYISDLTGKVISSEIVETNGGHVINKQYDFSSFNKGIYLITFKQSGEVAITKKLIVR